MTLAELEDLPREELVRLAISVGLHDDVYNLPRHELTQSVLIRVGEAASEEAWNATYVYSRLRSITGEVAALRGLIGRSIKRLDTDLMRTKAVAEASLMTRVHNRPPLPEEVAELDDDALSHLSRRLGISAPSANRIERLNLIAEVMGYSEWWSRPKIAKDTKEGTSGFEPES